MVQLKLEACCCSHLSSEHIIPQQGFDCSVDFTLDICFKKETDDALSSTPTGAPLLTQKHLVSSLASSP